MPSDEAANFILDRGRAVYQELQEAKAEIDRLRAALDEKAGIAEGSRTHNSLPHIAKIAQAAYQQPPECVFECRSADGGNSTMHGAWRAWCQTHGFYCPKLTTHQQTVDKS